MTQPQSTTTNMCTPLHIETPTNDYSVLTQHHQGCDEQNGTLPQRLSISIFQNHDSSVGHDARNEITTTRTCPNSISTSATTSSCDTSSTSDTTTTATCTTTTTTTHARMATHLVLSTDTLAGLLLTYRISKQALQRANPGCIVGGGNAVQVGDRLHIPMTHNNNHAVVPVQDTSTLDYQTAAVLEHCRFLTVQQAQSYVTRNHYNIDHAIQHAKAVRQQQQDQLARQAQVERQRKQDAMEIQRILLVQQQQQAKQREQAQQAMMHNQSTELTRLMNNNNHNHPSMYLDEPNEPEKDQGKPLECVAACCSLVGLVVVEWIRHAIPLPQV